MKAFGNFVVETNNGDGWQIESDPDQPNTTLVTRKRGREIKAAYERILADAEKPYRVRVVPAGKQIVPHHDNIYGEPRMKGIS